MLKLARRITLTLLTATLALWIGYLVLANAALALAPRVIDRREPVQMSFDAYTLIPGTVHVRDFKLRVEDRWTQWGLDVARASVQVSVLPVLKRTFHAKRVDADGVVMRLRMKRTEAELAETPADAFPPISGFGPPLRNDLRFPFGRPLKAPWTLEMENVTANAQQIWVEGERFDGAAIASGQFRMSFDRLVEVGPAELKIGSGSLQHRGTQIASGLWGDLQARLDAFNPRQVRDGAVASQLSVNGALHAAPMKNSKFDANVALERGVLQSGTSVDVTLPNVERNLGAIAGRGDVLASVRVAENEKVNWSARVSGLRAWLPEHPDLAVNGGTLTMNASSKGTNVRAMQLPTQAKIDLPDARIRDLSALNELIPEPVGLDVLRGTGQLQAHLMANMADQTATGTVRLRASKLRIARKKQELQGAFALDVRIARADLKHGRADLGGSRLQFENMQVMRGGDASTPWSGVVSVPEAKVDLRKQERFSGHVVANFNGTGPLCRAIVEELHVPGWARGLLQPNLVSADARLTLGKKLLAVQQLQARVGRLNVRANAEFMGKSQHALADVSMGRLRVGFEKNGENTHVKPFARHTWFEGKQVAMAE